MNLEEWIKNGKVSQSNINLEEVNWDMVKGQIVGGSKNVLDSYKFLMMIGKEFVHSHHECLYEGISGYLKLENHLIIAQATVIKDGLPLIERTPNIGENSYFERRKIAPSSKLWRYTNFDKFEDLIKRGDLYYSRLDKFSDNLEGVSSYTSIKRIIEDPMIEEGDKHKSIELYMKRMESNKKNAYVSCWHINETINYKMWDIYGGGSVESVAILTTKKVFDNEVKKSRFPVLNEPVQYFEEPYFNQYAYWFPTFFKRKSFEHENELRSIIFIYEMGLNYMRIKVDLEKFIKKNYVHPDASKEYFHKIRLLVKENKLRIPVVRLTR